MRAIELKKKISEAVKKKNKTVDVNGTRMPIQEAHQLLKENLKKGIRDF